MELIVSKRKYQLNNENIENIILGKDQMEIITNREWRLPVKYRASKESVNKLLSNITHIKSHGEQPAQQLGFHKRNMRPDHWIRFTGEIMFKYRNTLVREILQISHSLAKVAVPKDHIQFNTKKLRTRKVDLIKTKHIYISHESEILSAVMPVRSECANKIIKEIQCITFHGDKMSIKSGSGIHLIEDVRTVRAVRRTIKSNKSVAGLWSKAVGSDVVYYTKAGRQLLSYSLIGAITGLKQAEGRVPIWRQAMQSCGLIDTDSDSEDMSEYFKRAEKKRKKRRKKRKKGEKKKEPTIPDDDSGYDEPEPTEKDKAGQNNKSDKLSRKIRIKYWRLGQLNIADIRRFTKQKWKGLAQIMDDRHLHGIALQELRVKDSATFTVDQHLYPGLTLLVEPTSCVPGENNGNAGGLGFLVRTELLDQGLFSQIKQIKSKGLYGQDNLAYIEIKVGTSIVKWANIYCRPLRGKVYEWDKISSVCALKGDKIVMGDINGSIIYSRPTEMWRGHGLGGSDKAGNENMKNTGIRLRKETTESQLTDISARGKYMWAPTRFAENGVNNKLDTIMVSTRLMNKQQAKVTDIFTPAVEPQMDVISDHQMLTMSIKANCSLEINLYTQREQYKLNRILNSHRLKRLFREMTDEKSEAITASLMQSDSLDHMAEMVNKILKESAVEIVGKRKVTKRVDTRIISDQPTVRAARRALTESKKQEALEILKTAHDGSNFKLNQAKERTRRDRNSYYNEIRSQRMRKSKSDCEKVSKMDDTAKSKFLHSKIQSSTKVNSEAKTKSSYATMTFEGRRAVANEPDQITLLLNSYTHYVSMDSTKTEQNAAVDQKTKKGVSKFTKSIPKKDEFDQEFKDDIDEKAKHIRDELSWDIKQPVDSTPMNKQFTMKEFKSAIKRLKKKLWKTCGTDEIHNWMLYLAGDKFHEALLQIFNQCWEKGQYPTDWFQTLISYIYKGKGPLHEFTSYRPIALTSSVVNIFKSMMLARIAPAIMKQIHASQGGFRTGSGSKEQLWALIEFLEEGLESETPTVFCTTDVHKAFDQVYRNGTIYLLYCHGIRGRMLHMLDLWITNNFATQLWKGHLAPQIHLDANGLRQGCVLSPILYLLIINTLISDPPEAQMPGWDNGMIKRAFSQGVQRLKKRPDLGEWLLYLFVDDTAFVSRDIETTNEMLKCYHNFTRMWRVRVNPDKCKLLKNKYCDGMGEGKIGDHLVQTVEFLKYLGYWIGAGGKNKNDEITQALATQLRFKIRALRETLGELLSTIYLETYATPTILYGAEFGNISNSDLEMYQAWSLSEILGIGRKGRAAGLWEGEVRRICVFSDYNGPTWSQLRSRDAMITYRSINRMSDSTLPKQQLAKRGNNNILVKNFMKKLGGGICPAVQKKARIKGVLSMNTPSKKYRWKQQLKARQRAEYNNWLNSLQSKLHSDVQTRLGHNLGDHVKGLGTGTAYFQSLKPNNGCTKSITHLTSSVPAASKVTLRRVKAGQISHTLVLEHMMSQNWYKKSFDQQLQSIMCPCNQAVQDIQHTVGTCEFTSHLNHTWVECIRGLLIQIKRVKGLCVADISYNMLENMQGHDCIGTMLHMRQSTGNSRELRELIKLCSTATNTFVKGIEELQKAQFQTHEE